MIVTRKGTEFGLRPRALGGSERVRPLFSVCKKSESNAAASTCACFSPLNCACLKLLKKSIDSQLEICKLDSTMNPIIKTNSLQTYTMLLYRKAIHPEFFAIDSRKRIENGGIEAEAWIFRGGHSIRFQQDKLCLCEVVTDQPHVLPERGLSNNVPCAGEHDHEESLSETLKFMSTVQTETLAEHLYLGTYKEMQAHARENESLVCDWVDPVTHKSNLSVIDLQRYRSEIHVQSWHLRSDCGLVLRTQSMFQLIETPTKTENRKTK
jgi:Protein of unknown function DUF2617